MAARIVMILTGSIAAFKACAVVSELVRRGHQVRAVATPSALQFVGAATLEGLTGEPVLSGLIDSGAALEHIRLGRWADAIVVCPATAHTLNRMSAGMADDLTGALFLAHDWTKPFLVAPAMNPDMWRHPATQASVRRLLEWGVRLLPPAEGRTACGEVGEGRLAEPPVLAAAIESAAARPVRRLKVLVTSGGTSEPIDPVRRLSNISTGATGATIADHFFRAGHEVVLLRAAHSDQPAAPCRNELFDTFDELDQALGRLLGGESFDAVIHAAAVGDFHIMREGLVSSGLGGGPTKLDSDAPITLRLEPNRKLVDGLRGRSLPPGPKIVAFKLTSGAGADSAAVEIGQLISRAQPDFVVHNDLTWRAAPPGAFAAEIHGRNLPSPLRCAGRPELAHALESLLTA